MATGKMKSADFEAVLEKNAAEIEAAKAAVANARDKYEREYFEAHVTENQVAIARLRKAVRDAQENLRDLEEARGRIAAARDAAAAVEFAANIEARWATGEQIAQRWTLQGQEIRATIGTLVEQVRAFLVGEQGRSEGNR